MRYLCDLLCWVFFTVLLAITILCLPLIVVGCVMDDPGSGNAKE
ncbi:MAG: hypothetical protein ACYC4U_11300 [Pirellulaceae bacterium]